MRQQLISALSIIIFLFGFVESCFAASAKFEGLGDLDGRYFYSKAYGISGDGTCVVGVSTSNSTRSMDEAFRWTEAEGMIALGYLPGFDWSSVAFGVSGDGSIVVGHCSSGQRPEAFRWTHLNGMTTLDYLQGAQAFGISEDGSVVVGYIVNAARKCEAFHWTEAQGIVGLGDLEGGLWSSDAQDVSGDGSVVVGLSGSTSGWEAFRWTEAEGIVGLGELEGGKFESVAYAISNDGSTIVGYSFSESPDNVYGHKEAFHWSEAEGMVGLGFLPGGWGSLAWDVSSDGSAVVGHSSSTIGVSSWQAFLWTESDGMISIQDILTNNYGLDLTGWTLYEATGISNDGLTIVGNGTNPDGNREAWIATIPPPAIKVAVDIKPGSCPNPVNVKSSGVLPVAILGTEDVNVIDIVIASVRLADPNVAPIRNSYEDVAAPVFDANDCNCTTDGPDGFLDLTLKFKTQLIVDAIGEVNDGDVLELELTGVLFDETPIEGVDCILIRGRHKPFNKADINKDGVVDTVDFAIFSENWLQSSIIKD